jgi:hypothetical protein
MLLNLTMKKRLYLTRTVRAEMILSFRAGMIILIKNKKRLGWTLHVAIPMTTTMS